MATHILVPTKRVAPLRRDDLPRRPASAFLLSVPTKQVTPLRRLSCQNMPNPNEFCFQYALSESRRGSDHRAIKVCQPHSTFGTHQAGRVAATTTRNVTRQP